MQPKSPTHSSTPGTPCDNTDTLHHAIAERAATLLAERRTVVVAVPTNQQADQLSQAIQQHLTDIGVIAAGGRAATLGHGDVTQRARPGDLVQTRRNDPETGILDDITDRASLCVGVTRGRYSNTIHAVGKDRDEVADMLSDAIGRHEPETWDTIQSMATRAIAADQRVRQAAARDDTQQRVGDWGAPLPSTTPAGYRPIGL